jgi:hypothetical protein
MKNNGFYEVYLKKDTSKDEVMMMRFFLSIKKPSISPGFF